MSPQETTTTLLKEVDLACWGRGMLVSKQSSCLVLAELAVRAWYCFGMGSE